MAWMNENNSNWYVFCFDLNFSVTSFLSRHIFVTLQKNVSKILQIVNEQKNSLKIQILDAMQHINSDVQFEWYQTLQHSAISVTKIL